MSVAPIDFIAFGILLLAMLRGMSLGLVREVFSIGALAAAVITVRVWNEPFGHWLQRASGSQLPHSLVPWLAGFLLAVGVLIAVGMFGRVMRQGMRAAGLGLFDRLGGAALGFAEGAIAAGALLLIIHGIAGNDSAMLARSRSFALLERAERFTESQEPGQPDVAAAPQSR
jgi:membrane protein required for colicin V production